MPTTTSSALPYPSSTDSPNGPLQLQNLALALDKLVSPMFATFAARNTAIPSPTPGQSCSVAGVRMTADAGGQWRWGLSKHVSGTTDASGYLVVNHGLGTTPSGCLLTPGPQATDLLNRVLSLNWASVDANNVTVYAHRTDTSAALPSNLIQFSMMAFV